MNRQTFTMIERYMHTCMQDSAHDRDHVYRVLYQALQIAQEEADIDRDVLIAACLLHDIGRPEQLADPSLCHAQLGAAKAERFLLENGWDRAKAAHIAACIRTHRFRKSDPPASLEAKILFDADKLDVVGAMGVARTLIYNGAVNRPIYSTGPDGAILDGTEETPDSFFREYRFKLEGMYGRFCTAKAAEMARSRQEAAVRFYDALYAEASDSAEEGRAILGDWLK